MTTPTRTRPGQLQRWTLAEYNQMATTGLFEDKHVELVEGWIVKMSPKGNAHTAALILVRQQLEHLFGAACTVRTEAPLIVGSRSQLEPDVAVVTGTPRDYLTHVPTTALLVVEIADSSLANDRTRKGRAYAAAGIPDYWIVNLVDGRLEVYRDPTPSGYSSSQILGPGDQIAPFALPTGLLAVADLLP